MFTKGQRVVCIDDKFSPQVVAVFNRLPVKGEVYTVRTVFVGRSKLNPKVAGSSDGEIGILLMELDNSMIDFTNKYGYEPGFSIERFAPIEEDRQDEQLGKEEEQLAEATAG